MLYNKMELKFTLKKILFVAVLLCTVQFLRTYSSHSRRRRHFNRHHNNNGKSKGISTKYILDVKMPGAHPRKKEEYLCTSSRRLPRRTSYIVEYEPHATATTAHHILLYGCKYPGSRKRIWKCDEGECIGTQKIIYAWAKNAKAVKMPKDVGFAIGGSSGIDYIVMQIHYAKAMKANAKDYSGIKLHLTTKRTKHLAEIYSFASENIKIPPKSIGFHADIACRYKRNYDMIPFAFRTHAHSTARVISGYRVRDNHWQLIGIGNPQLPQVFYPIPAANRTRIHYGDILAARCTYDTPHRNRWTKMGATSKDEMCNFYLMYYKIYGKRPFHHEIESESSEFYNECVDIQDQRLKKSLKFPPDSDKLPDRLKTNHTHKHMHMHAGRRDEEDDGVDESRDESDTNQGLRDVDGELDPDVGGDENPFDNEFGLDTEDGSDHDENPDGLPASVDDNGDSPDSPDKTSGDKKMLSHGDSNEADSGISQASLHKKKHKTVSKINENGNKKEPHGETVTKSDDKLLHHDSKPKRPKKTKTQDTMEEDLSSLAGLEDPKPKNSVSKKLAAKVLSRPSVDGDWPYEREGLANVGQASGLALDKKHLVVLHRADRVWNRNTFDDNEQLTRKFRVKISQPTVLHLDPVTGAVVKKWGENRFYLPHGLTIDSKDNIWITDVGAHQVMKFSPKHKERPALTLGIALTPGDDDDHFCKPADVAVESSGVFYVADGYCNNRIMKFSADGDLIHKWGHGSRGKKAKAGEFNIPHSLALDDKNGILYVADRENGRIQSFDTRGRFKSQIHHAEFGGRLFAVSFTPANGGLLYAISGQSHRRNAPKPSGFTINPKDGKIINKWSPFSKGFTRPHDVQATPDNSAIYVSEIGPNRVWMFDCPKESHQPTESQVTNREHKEDREIDPTTQPLRGSSAAPAEVDDEEESSNPSPYTLKKPESDEAPIVPAIVVVAVLATPIALICAAATIQHLRFKHKRDKAIKKRNSNALMPKSRSGCFSCCKTKKYYYDNKRGFDKLIGEDDSDESSDDYFVRKGAI